MTTAHHTPHPFGAALTSVEMNRPLGQLDSAIATVIATGSGASTTLTAQALAGQASLIVASSAAFAVGDPIYIGTGATFESRIIATVPNSTTITVTVNLSNTYAIGQPVSKSPVEIVDARAGLTSLGARLATMETAVNVKRYGAKGDGTTDDTAAIQAAITAAAGGGTVYFPDGRYRVTAALTIANPRITLAGAGLDSVIATTTDHTVITVSAAAVRIQDLAIEMPTVGTTTSASRGIYFGAGSQPDCAARRVKLTGGYRAIMGESCAYVAIRDCDVSGFLFDGIYLGGAVQQWQVVGNHVYDGCTNIPAGVGIGAGIMLNTSTDNLVQGNNIHDNGTASPNGGAGIWVNVAHRNRIIGNRCVSNGKAGLDLNGQGIVLAGTGGSKNNLVEGNYCAGNASEGITLHQVGTSLNTVVGNVCRANALSQIEIWGAALNTVVGNVCEGSTGGVGIMVAKGSEASGATHTLLVGNHCHGNWQNGIQVTDSPFVTVADNICLDNGRGGSALTFEASGVVLNGASSSCMVKGNLATDSDPAAATKKQLYGLSILNTASAIVADNRFAGNKTGDIENPQLISTGAVSVYHSAVQSIANATFVKLLFDTKQHDPDGFHFTSAAALTGTVAKTSGSPTITGTGTLFTTELSVGQVISIPGGTIEQFVVRAIASATSLTVWANAANTASGQTATRVNSALAVPDGMGGLYLIQGTVRYAANATGERRALVKKNGSADLVEAAVAAAQANDSAVIVSTVERLAPGDYLELLSYQTSGVALNVVAGALREFSLTRIAA